MEDGLHDLTLYREFVRLDAGMSRIPMSPPSCALGTSWESTARGSDHELHQHPTGARGTFAKGCNGGGSPPHRGPQFYQEQHRPA
jgi:hypothetical protein